MPTTTFVNAQETITDASGNVTVIRPETISSQVKDGNTTQAAINLDIEQRVSSLEGGTVFISSFATATIAAASWDTNTNTYSLENDYPSATYDISVQPAPTATKAQYKAWGSAYPVGTTSGNVIKALGTVPSVDIPVIVEYMPNTKYGKTTITILASGWSNGVYSLETSYPVAQYDIYIEPAPTATIAQYKAWGAAYPIGSTSANSIKALGTVPTVDIPVIVRFARKSSS